MNLKGNPDFGTRYRLNCKTAEPLTEQIKTSVSPKIKLQLKEIAGNKNCTVPDLMRTAIEKYLDELQAESVGVNNSF